MRLRNSVSSASGTFITRNGRIAALSLPVCSPRSSMALDLSDHRVRERESIRAQCEARLLRPPLRGHRLIVTLGRWRRHTALLERQCQEVYRSSAASLLHLGDRARKDSVERGRPFAHSVRAAGGLAAAPFTRALIGRWRGGRASAGRTQSSVRSRAVLWVWA